MRTDGHTTTKKRKNKRFLAPQQAGQYPSTTHSLLVPLKERLLTDTLQADNYCNQVID